MHSLYTPTTPICDKMNDFGSEIPPNSRDTKRCMYKMRPYVQRREHLQSFIHMREIWTFRTSIEEDKLCLGDAAGSFHTLGGCITANRLYGQIPYSEGKEHLGKIPLEQIVRGEENRAAKPTERAPSARRHCFRTIARHDQNLP